MMHTGKINDRWELTLPDFRVDFHAERPLWESSRLAAMYDQTMHGQTIIDCGAEHGDFTALYRQWVGDAGHVVPVEPQAIFWPCIQTTWEANGYREIPTSFFGFVDDAGQDGAGQSNRGLHDQAWPDCGTEIIADPGFLHLVSQHVHIPCARLDWLAAHLPAAPDHIVIDIEGAELLALQGARTLMQTSRPTFWVSVHPPPLWEWYGATPADIETFAYTLDYTIDVLPNLGGEGEQFYLVAPR